MAKEHVDIVKNDGTVLHGELTGTRSTDPDSPVYKGFIGGIFETVDAAGNAVFGTKEKYATIKTPDGKTHSGKLKE